MIQKIIAIALGGSIGAVSRYLIYITFEKSEYQSFPWATLAVNLLGSFIIGFLWGVLDKFYVSPGIRLFLFVGILGSFTTFSTFAFDVFSLARDGNIKILTLYILSTNIIGISLAFAGYYLSKVF
jgi:fluoride exporter